MQHRSEPSTLVGEHPERDTPRGELREPDSTPPDLDTTPERRSPTSRRPLPLRVLSPEAVLEHLGPLVTALRWATVTVGIVVAIPNREVRDRATLVAASMLVANTLFRTVRPLRIERSTQRTEVAVLVDLAVMVVALSISGRWTSPFLLTPVPTILLAGYGWGYREGLAAATLTAGSVGVVDVLVGPGSTALRDGLQAALILGLAAVIGAFTRHLWQDVARREELALDHVARMTAANDLLLALHEVVQTLPSSLDLGEVVTSTQRRFRELFEYTTATLLVRDDAAGLWRVELAEGVRLGPTLAESELPSLVADSLDSPGAVVTRDLLLDTRVGFAPLARSVLVCPLRARNLVVGLVTIEHGEPNHYGPRDAELLDGLAEPLALAVDNAQWFSRLRTLGAEAERARIARDLHDRLAQSLAYVAFELERLSLATESPELVSLHEVVRGVVGELRETLYQLRADVSESADLEETTRDYLSRFQERTGIAVTFSSRGRGQRLPLQVEQELWRIVQEALTNVERHADARRVWVTWMVAGGRAWLEIRDDGRGFQPLGVRGERFGLVGMRERADAIAARLTVDSEPSCGARILVELEVPK